MKKEIKNTKMADGKVKKSLERDGIKPLRIEIPAELQPGNHGLTETVFSDEKVSYNNFRCIIWRT